MSFRLSNFHKVTAVFIFGAAVISLANQSAVAGSCSPGIPCTDYTLTADPTAGTDTTLNGPKTGKTAPYAERSCDGNFMNQIISNAHLGASRELIMSEQMINKPDSVLAYTCFDQLLARTAQNGGVFSETQTFGAGNADPRGFALKAGNDEDSNSHSSSVDGSRDDSYDGDNASDGAISPDSGSGLIGVPPPDCTANTADEPCETYTVDLTSYDGIAGSYDQRLDVLLERVVLDHVVSYLNGNFNQSYLGGTTNINRTASAINAGAYNCSEMATIWQLAQCSDFGEYDRFRTFSDLVLQDPRVFSNSSGGNVACSPSNIATDATNKVEANLTLLPPTFPFTISKKCPDADANNTGAVANTGIENKQIDVANNCNYTYADFDIYNPLSYLVKSPALSPTSNPAQMAAKTLSGHPLLCSDPLPTGVLTISYTHSLTSYGPITYPLVIRYVHYDHVCPNPGCYYIPVKVPMPVVPGTSLSIININSIPAIASSGICSPL